MPLAEVVRRTLLGLDRASDEEIAGYLMDAYLIRVHPRLVASVRRSMKHEQHVLSARKRRARGAVAPLAA